jgi:hypothetical protein
MQVDNIRVCPISQQRPLTLQNALQDSLIAQPIEKEKNIDQKSANALQDLLSAQSPVIIGLISTFIGSPLQDDIANTLLAMQESGQDILSATPKQRRIM